MEFETANLIVRNPIENDAYDIFRNYAQDTEVTQYLTWEPHTHISQTMQWIDFCIQNSETSTSRKYVLFHKEDNQAIGMIDFRIDSFMAEFGYVLAKKYWGKGLMTEAIKPVLESIYSMPNIYRLWAVHDINNPASGKVMQKLGLSYEGILKRFCLHPNVSTEPRDAVLYARCK